MDKTRIGIIGAAGFIGTNLIRYLKENSAHSTIISDRIDLNHSEQIRYFLTQVDCIIYLAHEGGPNQEMPLSLAREKNITPLKNLLAEIKGSHKKHKIIYLSSGGTVYGISKNRTPWRETDALNPISTYGQIKVEAEKLLEHASVDGICNTICLRAANPYGNYFVHSKPQGVIDVIITRLLGNETFVLYDSEKTVRDYIHLDDLNLAILKSISYSSVFDVFNIASGSGTALIDIIQKIEKLSSKKLNISSYPPADDAISVPWSVLNIDKAKQLLKWQPQIALEAGLNDLILRKIKKLGASE